MLQKFIYLIKKLNKLFVINVLIYRKKKEDVKSSFFIGLKINERAKKSL